MTKFLLITDDNEKEKIINDVFSSDEIIIASDETFIFDNLDVEAPDIVIIDGDTKNIDIKSVCRQIKRYTVISLLIIGNSEYNKDVVSNVNLIIKTPIDKKLLSATITSALKTRYSIMKMAKSNQELARSLYQLNVLYNTSSQLAGTLAHEFARRMLDKGVYVVAFCYPVVPKGKDRIRTQISAGHTKEDIDFAVKCFGEVKAEMGL